MNIEERLIESGRELAKLGQDIDQLEQNLNIGSNQDKRAVHREKIENLELKLLEFNQRFLQLEHNIIDGHKEFEREFHTHLEAMKHHYRSIEDQLGGVRLAHAESWHLGEGASMITAIFDKIGNWVDQLLRRNRNLEGHRT
ncbi:hypothetical protein [Candidatus Nitrosacidococcus sp. I8]|uniref:hypothetical protein n=1 Tax=Candidatus Nitrosacidococcus sp. I8 TaxID=2942908 RepID=UPI0022270F64|nr:hypothetical protein [Candidatus Nitrosacidococcus sp. I8]CAH9017946.1 hypothetical protein NURINAE_00641 [Candidatus Nitrosacidococcus sp. I8]